VKVARRLYMKGWVGHHAIVVVSSIVAIVVVLEVLEVLMG